MKWVMSLAAGLAIGYFVWQAVTGNKNGGRAAAGRLHKSVKDKKLAGVFGGIAEYLNVDPTIIRLAFALLAVGWGSGVMAYIICAIVLPEGGDGDDAGEDETEEE